MHGRALIYVWAIEQDELSKRTIPDQDPAREDAGQDVLVPWVLTTQKTGRQGHETKKKHKSTVDTTTGVESIEKPSKVFNRYYHMFSKGELYELTGSAIQGLGLAIGSELEVSAGEGVEVVQCGWERSNYYIEIRRWRR